jgi:hypothetical protein
LLELIEGDLLGDLDGLLLDDLLELIDGLLERDGETEGDLDDDFELEIDGLIEGDLLELIDGDLLELREAEIEGLRDFETAVIPPSSKVTISRSASNTSEFQLIK